MYVSLRLLYKLSSGCKKYTIQKRKKKVLINNFQFIDFQKDFLNFEKKSINIVSEQRKTRLVILCKRINKIFFCCEYHNFKFEKFF